MAQALKISIFLILFFVGSSCQQDVPSQGSAGSNGREFIFAIPSFLANPVKMMVNLTIIGMSRDTSYVTVHVTGLNHTEVVNVRYHQAATVGLPYKAVAGFDSDYVNTVDVVATKVVTVRCIVGYRIGDNPGDGFLVLPTPALDTEYIVATVPPPEESYTQCYAQFTVSAVRDNTSIEIVSKVALTVFKENFVPPEVVKFSLDRHQSIMIRAEDDLTGTRVTATEAVAIVSGNNCGTIPRFHTITHCYYLVEQLIPTSTWGTEYYVFPFRSNAMTHAIRMILKVYETAKLIIEDDAVNHVTVEGDTSSFDYILSGNRLVKITAKRPMMIVRYVQYIASGKQTKHFSGAMMIVPPKGQLNEQASVVMPLPKEMIQRRRLIIPKLSVCIIINCSYVDALLVNGKSLSLLVSVSIFRPPDLRVCAIEISISADPGDVITFSSSSSLARMQVTAHGYYGEYLNFLYTASQRFEKHVRDSAQPTEDEEGSTTSSMTSEEPAATYMTRGIKFHPAHYAYVAGGGVLCLLAVACLICFVWKCLHKRINPRIDQPAKETSSTKMSSHTDYEDINIEMCTFVRTPSAMTTASNQEMFNRPSLPKKSRGRFTSSFRQKPTDGRFNVDNVHGQDCRSVVSPKSYKPEYNDDYGYVNQSLPEEDYHDYMPMKKANNKQNA